ncbi:hypothetical protein J3Q64DRAFT_1822930 [Phycomyces blakesleeanus]|uniref:Potassium channel domain-containing protein n=2 Tax=Phycomyces blakesleeanus TaxID=4837 RepID=A0A167PLX5_PHYB8|nr:hypothetical protein PHYBLDRAFT_71765 [Phycomyces blakesleeanus NRRL 1555(-)]OAD78187.1 hypothetical protein PHYBLDRAFT_71765 [Phycomyces blakesleeanus NRRL 1555(-)]|eukprot:XP_018296227.1 hypothetical protein PHYBLDRAFT_71765 [Phycomyces blakesleeanus NRRL 1555(-)]
MIDNEGRTQETSLGDENPSLSHAATSGPVLTFAEPSRIYHRRQGEYQYEAQYQDSSDDCIAQIRHFFYQCKTTLKTLWCCSHSRQRWTGRSSSTAELPFLVAAFGTIYGTFILVRALAVDGWLVDHSQWDGKGHAYDKNPIEIVDRLERWLVIVAFLCGIINCLLLIARTRLRFYTASLFCKWLAFIHAIGCLCAVYLFADRVSPQQSYPVYVYSRGFWSCLGSGLLETVAVLGFTIDWMLSYPYSDLSLVLKGLVLPSIMACVSIALGALAFMKIEQWTYNQAVVFCTTALTTIGYGDVAPITSLGRLFFLFYAITGVCVIGYFLLSIRAVMTGNTSRILRVNLMRVESFHNHIRKQRQRHAASTAVDSTALDSQLEPHVLNGIKPVSSTFEASRSFPRRTRSTLSMYSTGTLADIVNDKDREVLVQIITRSGIVRMSIILAFSWFGGAAVFCYLETQWNYLDALYFAFATQLTIGFGDLVPQTALAQEFWFMYIVFSIAIAAYFISLFGDVLVEKFQLRDEDENEEFYESTTSGFLALARSLTDESDDTSSNPLDSLPIENTRTRGDNTAGTTHCPECPIGLHRYLYTPVTVHGSYTSKEPLNTYQLRGPPITHRPLGKRTMSLPMTVSSPDHQSVEVSNTFKDTIQLPHYGSTDIA